jgi:uncharacterized protein (TIGR02453 family)
MESIKKSTFQFLNDIKYNNNRDWFLQNKDRYNEARADYESFIQRVIDGISEFDPILKGLETKNCVYRFNRDIRFSNDKSPYKWHFGAFIVRGGKKNGDRLAGYYVHIEPGHSLVAGGAYMPPAPWLQAIREKIDDDPVRITAILNDSEFIKYFRELDGEKLKKAPKGYPADHPYVELLKYKSYLAFSDITDEFAMSGGLYGYVIGAARAMKPLNDFLNDY